MTKQEVQKELIKLANQVEYKIAPANRRVGNKVVQVFNIFKRMPTKKWRRASGGYDSYKEAADRIMPLVVNFDEFIVRRRLDLMELDIPGLYKLYERLYKK